MLFNNFFTEGPAWKTGGSSLENYTSNNTRQQDTTRRNTSATRHNTSKTGDNTSKTTRAQTTQHEYNTTQHEYKGGSGSKNRALLCTFCY